MCARVFVGVFTVKDLSPADAKEHAIEERKKDDGGVINEDEMAESSVEDGTRRTFMAS